MTCHSAAAIEIEDVRAKQAKTNARTEQRFTGRGMPALWYRKRRRSQGAAASNPPKFSKLPRLRSTPCWEASPSLFRHKNSRLTCAFFALNTGNVLSHS